MEQGRTYGPRCDQERRSNEGFQTEDGVAIAQDENDRSRIRHAITGRRPRQQSLLKQSKAGYELPHDEDQVVDGADWPRGKV